MLLRMRTTYASPLKCVNSGEISDFPKAEAEQLLAGKYAAVPTPQELAEWEKRRKAMRSHRAEDDRG